MSDTGLLREILAAVQSVQRDVAELRVAVDANTRAIVLLEQEQKRQGELIGDFKAVLGVLQPMIARTGGRTEEMSKRLTDINERINIVDGRFFALMAPVQPPGRPTAR